MIEKIARNFSARNRKKKYEIFKRNFDINENTTILDIGFSDREYSNNDNYIEKNHPFQKSITALGIDKPIEFPSRYPQCKVVSYDGKDFPFADKIFAVGWSNAVVEHVGSFEKQSYFIGEILRTCRSAFFTTPNKYFPIEVHTRIPILHYLPKKYFDEFLNLIGKGWASGNYMNLLSKKDIKNILKIHGVNNYIIIHNRLLGLTMDFVVIINPTKGK